MAIGDQETEQVQAKASPETLILCMLPGYEQAMVVDPKYMQIKGVERIGIVAAAIYNQKTEWPVVVAPKGGINAPIQERANFVTACVKDDLRDVGMGEIAEAIEKCGADYEMALLDPNLGEIKTNDLLLQINSRADEQIKTGKLVTEGLPWEDWMKIVRDMSDEVVAGNKFGEKEAGVAEKMRNLMMSISELSRHGVGWWGEMIRRKGYSS